VKIILYTHSLAGGGGERLWASLATALSQRGHDVIFAQDYEAQENQSLLDPGIRRITLGRGHGTAILALARLLRTERPDIALSALGGSNVKLIAARSLSRRAMPVVISYHGFDDWRGGWLGYASYALLPLWSRIAARTIAVSTGLADALVTRWRAKKANVVTLLNPVFFPGQLVCPTAADLAARPKRLLAVGRLVAEKDYPTLLAALAASRHADASLTILGTGPLEAGIRREISRLGLDHRVDLKGYVAEPWPAYAEARCLVLSSVSEAFGNVLIEAMAHGLPVVSTATAGAQQILDHGRFGAIVPIGDSTALAAAIDAALDDPGNPQNRAERAAAFSMDARVPAYEALIDEVVSQNRY
jgi:glycosyltransferase involved in cell wall biosynthesis